MHAFAREIETALDAGSGIASDPVAVEIVGRGSLPSCFDVSGLAVASIAAASVELARFAASASASDGSLRVEVDRRLASMWFGFTLRPQGWALPSPWDPIAGDYPTRDGWIRLHTNAPHHRDAALALLGVAADRSAVAAAVAGLNSEELESALVERGACAAAMRTQDDWARHPQGRAVSKEPLVAWETWPCRLRSESSGTPARPLAGLRVLDLTRVLAGPVGTRFLAFYGAEVLRIDPPDWDEPAVVPEVTVGKQCAGLDLTKAADRARFESLLAGADLLVHGYRPGALARLGYDAEAIRALRPGIVDVALCAYGWTGPWRERRGFDSLVQMSSGIAHTGSLRAKAPRPTPLPVQALDHATGYLMAAAALRGLRLRRDAGLASSARLSLARTASLLTGRAPDVASEALEAEDASDLAIGVEQTTWGPARRLRIPVRIADLAGNFDTPATPLRSSDPAWNGGAVASAV